MALKKTPQVNEDTAADTEKGTQVDKGTEKDTTGKQTQQLTLKKAHRLPKALKKTPHDDNGTEKTHR